jgi:hypothetical protein
MPNKVNATQSPLFTLPPVQEKYRKRGWFYITRRAGNEMLVAIDPHGKGIWLDHDLQRHVPHIINSLNTAKIVMRAVGGTEILRCWYTKIAGQDIRF